jgi:hypothetical protein
MTVAGDVRRARTLPALRQLPMDCPYCEEPLDDAPHGWVCRRCRSTVGVEWPADLREEGLR